MIKKGIFFLFFLCFIKLKAQHSCLPLSHDANLIYEQEIITSKLHTSFKPLIKSTIRKKDVDCA